MKITSWKKAEEFLKEGKVGVIPTDTIYGISCLAFDEKAVRRVKKQKNRKDEPFIVLISKSKDLDLFGIKPSNFQKEKLKSFWPGPVSVIFPVSSEKLKFLSKGKKSLAIRLPQDQKLQELISKTGPIISTSANPKGQEPASNVGEAQNYFDSQMDFYVDEGEKKSPPSSVVAFEGEKMKVLRKGAGNI